MILLQPIWQRSHEIEVVTAKPIQQPRHLPDLIRSHAIAQAIRAMRTRQASGPRST